MLIGAPINCRMGLIVQSIKASISAKATTGTKAEVPPVTAMPGSKKTATAAATAVAIQRAMKSMRCSPLD